MSPDIYVGNVVNPAGLAGEKLQWMRSTRESGSWQSSLGVLGFYQIRGRYQHDPKAAWTFMEINVWVSEARVEGPQLTDLPAGP